MILSTQLKKLLKQRDLTVAQLSRACGISQKTISDWLISKRSPRNLNHVRSVANYLEVSIDYLLFGETKIVTDSDEIRKSMDEINAGLFEVVLRRVKK